jgi:SAM-dependent methyltransferase
MNTQTEPEAQVSSAILALSDDEIAEAIEPFVASWPSEDDPAWRNIVRSTSRRIRLQHLRSVAKAAITGKHRGQQEVEHIYSARWANDQFKPFTLPETRPTGGGPWYWSGRALRMKVTGGRRARLLYLMTAIDALRPRRVLEVGFGEGLNLALLANRFPTIEFQGLEYTAGGVQAARAMIGAPSLADHLRDFSPQPLVSNDSHTAIKVTQGSAANMPFQDGEFDVVFTNLALEQMEEIRTAALSEISRVCAKHALFIEPFRDLNETGLARTYVRAHNYFQGRIADLSDFNFDVIAQTTNLPSKIFLNVGIVVARKHG